MDQEFSDDELSVGDEPVLDTAMINRQFDHEKNSTLLI